MHSLSGGFAQLGYRSNPGAAKVTGGASDTGAELRSEDGLTKMSMSGAGGVSVTTDKSVAIAATGGTSMTGNMDITGTLTVTGEIVLNGISLSTHKHTGVTPGGGTSAGPTN
jgi:phage baseplate assembly protein V